MAIDWAYWLVQLIIAVAVAVVAYLIMPTPDGQLSNAGDELQSPTAEAGRALQVVQGTITIKNPNIIWWGDRGKRIYKVKVGGGKK